jgi:hypothetical protein
MIPNEGGQMKNFLRFIASYSAYPNSMIRVGRNSTKLMSRCLSEYVDVNFGLHERDVVSKQ